MVPYIVFLLNISEIALALTRTVNRYRRQITMRSPCSRVMMLFRNHVLEFW